MIDQLPATFIAGLNIKKGLPQIWAILSIALEKAFFVRCSKNKGFPVSVAFLIITVIASQ